MQLFDRRSRFGAKLPNLDRVSVVPVQLTSGYFPIRICVVFMS